MTRLPPIPPADWPPAMREALAALRPADTARPALSRGEGRPKALNALGTFAHHPALTRAFNTFNGHILFTTTLTDRQRELLVLRVAALRRCDYEWAQHLVLAEDAGITPDEIERIAAGDRSGFDSLEAALLAAAEELVADTRLSDATWAALSGSLDERQLLDVIFTVGAYEVVAMLFNGAGVELDDDVRKPASP